MGQVGVQAGDAAEADGRSRRHWGHAPGGVIFLTPPSVGLRLIYSWELFYSLRLLTLSLFSSLLGTHPGSAQQPTHSAQVQCHEYWGSIRSSSGSQKGEHRVKGKDTALQERCHAMVGACGGGAAPPRSIHFRPFSFPKVWKRAVIRGTPPCNASGASTLNLTEVSGGCT